MGHIVQTVAGLTDQRDRDALVNTLLSVIQGVIGASRLTLWKVARREASLWVQRRAEHTEPGALADEAFLKAIGGMLFPLRLRSCLSDCFDSRIPLRGLVTETGDVWHVFPVTDGHDVVDILEIVRPTAMSSEQEQMVLGMLRIYCNHRGILDYGDCDELTGLRNRRSFHDTFVKLSKCAECDKMCADDGLTCTRGSHLALIDIDHFKRINDQFGHPFGDEVLVLFSGLMRESFNDPERLFRFGGEEFLVMLENETMEDAEASLDRFRRRVAEFRFPQVGPVTASIGFTRIGLADTGAYAFGRADAALYVAKHSGRNQVLCHEALVTDGVIVIEDKVAAGQDVELF